MPTHALRPGKNAGRHRTKTIQKTENQATEKALELNPNYPGSYLGMASLLAAEGKTAEALAQVEQAIERKADFEILKNDADLAPLRALPEWLVLMKKYFPEQVKH